MIKLDWVTKARTGLWTAQMLLGVLIVALSGHVNHFMGFFYVADRFPLVVSILTLVILVPLFVHEKINYGNTRFAQPIVQMAYIGALFIIWTSSNSFSTNRWRNIQPKDCASIPMEDNPEFFNGVRVWCQEIQILRATIWIEWVLFALTLFGLLAFCLLQTRYGSHHVWTTPLPEYDPFMDPQRTSQISKGKGKGKAAFREHISGEKYDWSQQGQPQDPYPFDAANMPSQQQSMGRNEGTSGLNSPGALSDLNYPPDPFYVPVQTPVPRV